MFPPGRARLATSPLRTGSAATMTMGIFVVAFWAARHAGVLLATITSTPERTNPSARAARRSYLPSAPRYRYGNSCLRGSRYLETPVGSQRAYSFHPAATPCRGTLFDRFSALVAPRRRTARRGDSHSEP